MVSKLKRMLTEWEKVFASYTTDKGLITRIYIKNCPKINDIMKKCANEKSLFKGRNPKG
jgi:hypothetical protein